jgi:2-polyprenyl-6-methoxyphenol hydroxylase-like FAD-dependent oxidoreductase
MATDTGTEQVTTRCCIAGGGPAGMMAGFLLARAGVDVFVLEKHRDFLRDFRGDTIHPSTLEVMRELGLLDSFLKRPHDELLEIGAQVGEFTVTIGDFSHLPTTCKFVALMPQWDFLNFLAETARQYAGFHLLMETEATDLIQDGERVRGIRARTPRGSLEIQSDLVIAADGRHSILRKAAGLEVEVLGAPIDVLWMRISRKPETDPVQTGGRVNTGIFFVTINRGDYWQCAYVIPKGGIAEIHAKGIEHFRQLIIEIAPYFADRIHEVKSWDDVKLLSVAVDRLRRWYREGFLCIGDSAHAMSPVGGIGINLAVQDAVAAVNILAPEFLRGSVLTDLLRQVQDRRMFPTRATQWVQVMVQNRILAPALKKRAPIRRLPLVLKLLNSWPVLRRIPARIVAIGFRPEHVKTPVMTQHAAGAMAGG